MVKARCSSAGAMAVTTLTLLFGNTAYGAGFGAYVDYSYAEGQIDFDDDVVDGDGFSVGKADYETDRIGVGLLFDTNVSKDRLFNYRLQIGYQHGFREFDGTVGNAKIESDGVTMSHTFGFGVLRTPDFRLWGGPSIRVNVDIFSDYDDARLREEPGFLSTGKVDDAVDVSGGFGPTLGLNWHMGSLASASLAVSYQYMFLGEFIGFSSHGGREHLLTVGLSMLFRGDSDQYRGDR